MSIIVGNTPARFRVVRALHGPCVERGFADRHNISSGALSCQLCVTYRSIGGCVTEIEGFVIFDSPCVDILLPGWWLEARCIPFGKV